MWHRRHRLWLEDRGWLGWELVKVLGCTWKITPWIFYWLSVSPWKNHPPNFCSAPHVLHVWCIYFFYFCLPISNAGSSGWALSLAKWLHIAWGNGSLALSLRSHSQHKKYKFCIFYWKKCSIQDETLIMSTCLKTCSTSTFFERLDVPEPACRSM